MHKLMIVDDERANLRLLERLFSLNYECLTASSGAEAIQLLQRHDVAVLITDQRMPEMTGIELLKQTAQLRPHMVRILLTGYTDVDALVEAINTGLVFMYVTKPWNNSDLKVTVTRAAEHYENNKRLHGLTLTNERMTAELEDMKLAVVSALSEAVQIRDHKTYEQAVRVAKYSSAIGETLGLSAQDQKDLASAALLHDLGHLGTSDYILGKRKNLTETERLSFNAHCGRGARILNRIRALQNVADAVQFQYENLDGTGYPRGLQGEQIPLLSRIIRVADEYDSLLHPHDSSAPLSPELAQAKLRSRSGKDFDPNVVKALEQMRMHISTDKPTDLAVNYA